MALTRDGVVAAAVTLLDESGLEGLTLRRLASRLGVAAPTLYWHVRDKRALLDLVAEAITAEQGRSPRPGPGQPWWEWLAESASAQYRALLAHRDAARVVAGNRPTEESLPVIDQVVGSLVDAGFPPVEAFESIIVIGNYVLGSALEYQAERARGSVTDRDAALAVRIREADDLPHLAAIRSGVDPHAIFRRGLDLLVSGLRARHQELVGARP